MIIKHKDLSSIRNKNPDKKIVFCSGSFDLTHAGHIIFFEDCKKAGDILVVMVGLDDEIRINKGPDRPVLNQDIRLKMIDSLKPVDYCFQNIPWIPGAHPLDTIGVFFESLKPDIYAINEDAFDIPHRRMLVKKHGVKLLILERNCPPEFEKISTTKIIEKIKRSN